MPPSSTGTYSNFAPVRASIAGIASWLRNALGLPTSNKNCGAVFFMAAFSNGFLYDHYHPTSLAVHILGINRQLGPVAERQLDCMVPDIDLPRRDQTLKSPAVTLHTR